MSPQRTNPESAPARRHRRDFRPRVVVKFRDDVIVPAIASLPTWLLERNESAWHELETWLPELAIAPIFGVGGETAIFDLVARARELDPRYRPPRFENYFRVDIPAGVNAPMVARAFAAFPTVQTAYVEPEPGSPPDVDPTNDPQSASQKYLLAAPESVDATYAWGYEGGDGAGQARHPLTGCAHRGRIPGDPTWWPKP